MVQTGMYIHDGGQVMHVAMVRGAQDVLPLGVETVDLLLKRGVCLRIREDAMEYTDESGRSRFCGRRHPNHAVVKEKTSRGRRLARKIFVHLL